VGESVDVERDSRQWRSILAGPRFVRRSAAGFGLVTAVTAATAIASALVAKQEGAVREQILEAYSDDLSRAFQAQLSAERMVAIGRGYLASPEADLLERLTAIEADLDVVLGALDRAGLSDHERDLVLQAKRSASVYRGLFDGIVTNAARERLAARAEAFRAELLPARADLDARLEDLVRHKRELQAEARRSATRMTTRTLAFMAGLGTVAVTLSLLLAWAFTRWLATLYRREQEAATRAMREGAAKEEILGVVAHDLRNPLSAIAMKANLIQRGTNDYRLQKQADGIVRLAARMEAFIQRLLQAASIEAGRLSISWKRCTVAEILATTMDTFGGVASQRSISLAQETSCEDVAFWGDPERIVQILSNLVGNAVKFTPLGGTVTIRVLKAEFRIRFEVCDTGPGIARQHLPHVFDRFWRADAGGPKGTGLGLYIAKGMVESHRGAIWVESQVGTGSAFIFEIPIGRPSAVKPAAKARPRPSLTIVTSRPTDRELAQHPHS
jgi:signal transduction histidine kinase